MAGARVTDPLTSHEAAASVRNMTATMEYVLKCLRRPGTDVDLVQRYKAYKNAPRASESGIRSRRAELARAGRVRIVDEVRLESGRMARRWVSDV